MGATKEFAQKKVCLNPDCESAKTKIPVDNIFTCQECGFCFCDNCFKSDQEGGGYTIKCPNCKFLHYI